MKTFNEREIKDLLTPQDRPEPPAGLAEAIKQEIPNEILFEPDEMGEPAPVPTMMRSRYWLMAASLLVAVGGGLFVLRSMDQMSAPEMASQQAVESSAAPEKRLEDRGLEDSIGANVNDEPQPSDLDAEESAESAAPRLMAPEAEDPGELARTLRSADDEASAQRLETRLRARGRYLPDGPVAPEPPTELANSAPLSVAGGAAEARSLERKSKKVELEQVLDDLVEQRQSSATESLRNELSVSSSMPALAEPEPSAAHVPSPPAARENEYRVSPPPAPRAVMRRPPPPPPMHEPAPKRLADSSVVVATPPPSTGGTTEPNDAPYGDVFFHDTGTNPFIDTEDDRLSTFGLDVDTGSYTVARRYLRDGHLPPREAIRVEELINYFDYGDEAPLGEEFALHAEGAPSIYGQNSRYYLLRFNLRTRDLADEDRRPAVLTFVVDVSGSMERENRLGLVQRALHLLVDQLRDDDQIALVTYGDTSRVHLEPTHDKSKIHRAIDELRISGATNVEAGLITAYELAARNRRADAINRLILCSDGVGNVGQTSADAILERVRDHANRGIELTTVGFGMGNYNDVLMERLADRGNGRYAYVDTFDEARRIFVENLTGTLQTLAADAKTQVEFNPALVERYRLLGYENRDIADKKFRDDSVDAGEIGVGHSVTALYEIKLARAPRTRDRIATLRLRYGSVDSGKMVEIERGVIGGDFVKRWENASPALQLTTLVAEYAEILKRSYWAKAGDLDDVFRRAQKVSARFPGEREVADFVSLVGRAADIRKQKATE